MQEVKETDVYRMSMTAPEKKKPDRDWLVSTPTGTKLQDALKTACRGNDHIATLLYHLLYKAYWEEKNNNIDRAQVDHIVVRTTLDDIIDDLQKRGCSVSKKTLIAWIVKLNQWEMLQSNGYRHTYAVYFKHVQEAINNPPTPEQPKPRGRHAHKHTSSQDCSFENTVKTTISHVKTTILPSNSATNDHEEIVVLRKEIVNLQSEIVVLRKEIVNLQSEIVKLQSYNSSQDARMAALEARFESVLIDNIKITKDSNIKTTKEDGENANANASVAAGISSQEKSEEKKETTSGRKKPSSSRKPKTVVVQNPLPEPEPDLSALTELQIQIYQKLDAKEQKIYLQWSGDERRTYDNYLGTMGYVVPLPITKGVIDNVKKLADVHPTIQDYKDIEQYAKDQDKKKPSQKQYYRGRGLKFWDYPREYASWRSAKNFNEIGQDRSNASTSPAPQDSPTQEKLYPWIINGNWEIHTAEEMKQLDPDWKPYFINDQQRRQLLDMISKQMEIPQDYIPKVLQRRLAQIQLVS